MKAEGFSETGQKTMIKPSSLASDLIKLGFCQKKFVFLCLKLKCVVILELLPYSPCNFASEH
jgi:hypothetical protein